MQKDSQNDAKSSQVLISFEETEDKEKVVFDKKEVDSGFELLGSLLAFLRKEKYMRSLMVCRQIKEITISNNVAIIDYYDDSVNEINSDEKLKSEIGEFFAKQGLGFKLKEKNIGKDDVQILNELLGGKLKKIS